jgi:stearoyl-CoA desaturase (Delta-9 desaturase)
MDITYEMRGRGAATVSRAMPFEHRAHAIGMLAIPPLATAYALYDAFAHGVRALDLVLCIVAYAASAIGISVGYHRMLSHGAFKAHLIVRGTLIIFGCMAGEGPPLYWAANHRRHHDFSDKDSDPHSPHIRDGEPIRGLSAFVHAHAGWTITHRLTNTLRYCPDLLRDPLVSRLGARYFVWLIGGLLLPAAIGGFLTRSLDGAFHGLLWGGFVRMFLLYHVTLAINSIGHLFGGRDFDVPDHSRNVAWLALPSFGEGWHNNHHAFPSSAYFGLRPLQVDLGGWLITLLKRAGLAYDVRKPSAQAIELKLHRTLRQRETKTESA